ncbi:MAG: hypothetical protein M1548_00360 [Actinobacteria bacterium]|nr:hypothetical protein [Chloroflexota bacterium]MCL5290974.1 hypothetical protein [Actinomycetota bacterium]
MSKRTLIARIITLTIALGGLVYLYMAANQPLGFEQATVQNSQFLWSFYGTGKTAETMLSRPHAVAIDKDGNIYLADTNHQRVLVLDPSRRLKATLDPGVTPALKKNPALTRGYLAVAVANNGTVYVADKLQGKIYMTDLKGRNLGSIDEMQPTALAVANNKLYAATYGHIVVYDLKGHILRKFGTRGSGLGEYDFPGGITADPRGNIYVSDSNNNRLVALNQDGKIIWVVGKKGVAMNDANRTFGLPAGLAIDEKGNLYVVDAFNGSVVVFDTQGTRLAEIGEWGKQEGQLYYPSGIVSTGKGRFIIADEFNDRLQSVKLTLPGQSASPIDGLSETLNDPVVLWGLLALGLLACTAVIVRKLLKRSSTAIAGGGAKAS